MRVGGDPGKRPVVLVGTIFYHGQKILLDEKTGEFNRKEAEKIIRNLCMIDVVGATPEAMNKLIDFVASVTDAPILMDSPSAKIRLRGLSHVKESGLINRIVYNSIIPEAKQDKLEIIKLTCNNCLTYLKWVRFINISLILR